MAEAIPRRKGDLNQWVPEWYGLEPFKTEGGFRLWAGDRLLAASDSQAELGAFVLGIATASGILPDEILDLVRKLGSERENQRRVMQHQQQSASEFSEALSFVTWSILQPCSFLQRGGLFRPFPGELEVIAAEVTADSRLATYGPGGLCFDIGLLPFPSSIVLMPAIWSEFICFILHEDGASISVLFNAHLYWGSPQVISQITKSIGAIRG